MRRKLLAIVLALSIALSMAVMPAAGASTSDLTIRENTIYSCKTTASGDLYIPSTVTRIASSAFSQCKYLTSITIPSSVTSIGDAAFEFCTSLTSITIPDSVMFDGGSRWFWGCTNLTSVTLPSGETTKEPYIGEYMFYGCTSLTSITIPDGVLSIGSMAFGDCTNLTEIIIPDSVTYISGYAFYACFGITDVYYAGSEEDWAAIDGSDGAFYFSPDVTIHYNSTGPDDTNPGGTDPGETDPGDTEEPGTLTLTNTDVDDVWMGVTIEWEPVEGAASYYISRKRADSDSDFSIIGSVNDASTTSYKDYAGYNLLNRYTYIYRVQARDSDGNDLGMYAEGTITYVSPVVALTASASSDGVTLTWSWGYTVDDSTVFNVYRKTASTDWTLLGTTTSLSCLDTDITHGITYTYSVQVSCDAGTSGMSAPASAIWLTVDDSSWSFANSYSDYDKERYNDGYYMTYSDFIRLTMTSGLSSTDRNNVAFTGGYTVPTDERGAPLDESSTLYQTLRQLVLRNNVNGAETKYIYATDEDGNTGIAGPIYREWGGSCYGMSVLTCLVYAGVVSASDIEAGAENLNSLSYSESVESAINYYHQQQYLNRLQKAKASFMDLSQSEQIDELIELATAAENGGALVLIGFQWYRAFNEDGSVRTEDENGNSTGVAHATVGYGIESGAYSFTIRDVQYSFTTRIKVYDCACPEDSAGNFDLYIDQESGIWAIPGWGVVSTTSSSRDSTGNNGQLMLVTADTSLINAVDYTSGKVSSLSSSGSLAYITVNASSEYTLSSETESWLVSGFTATNLNGTTGINIAISANITTEGNTTDTTATAFLPDADGTYTVQTGYAVSFNYENDNCLTAFSAAASGTVTFSANGSFALSADEETSYTARLVSNDDFGSLPCSVITLSDNNASEITVEVTDDGLLVSGDDLDEMVVTGDNSSVEIIISTNESEVLIAENDSGDVAVYADENHDGDFETELGNNQVPNPFTDVDESNYFFRAVLWAIDNGITGGTTETTFSPFQTAERCQVVTFLWRAAGCPEPTSTENPFTDVDVDDYFYTAVLWAVENGITTGTSDTTFSPYATCERCQVVTFLYRYFGEPEITTTTNPFTDVNTGNYFYNAVQWAVENGITSGTTATTFSPYVTCERCMVVTFLYRALAE